jgi:NADH:ubiquinone oxidoreductase subunit 6 (subunit J)
MINIKTSENTSSKAFKLFITLCGCCGLFLNQVSFFSQTHNLLLWNSDLYLNFDSLLSFLTLSQLLFSFYYFSFLIAGLILLVAIIGAILLTFNFNSNNKSQNISKQNSRVSYFLLIK